MAIIQISKIQQRSGNLVDLPQLSEAQLGWANDAKRLFIGGTGNTTTDNENIEVLTSYSNITFSQINGSEGNLNIVDAESGEILGFDGTNWVNKGGNAAGLINLGAVANVRISGGVNGYVLQTDGLGNLSWTTQTGGGGNGAVAGSNTQIQFNNGGSFGGNSGFTFDYITGATAIPGTLSVSNTITGTRLISNVATGTAPFVVTSTTQVANLSVATAGSATTAGTVTTAAQPNITSVGTLSSLSVTGNISAGNLSVTTGTVTMGTLTTGGNTTAGTITGNWSLSTGSQLRATYADLAEYYESDAKYEPGTVLAFGGNKEVTLADDGTTRVAGIVSTNPAYVLNTACKGEHIVALALQGRVPCKVRGNIKKGDMMVSAGNGFARPTTTPVMAQLSANH